MFLKKGAWPTQQPLKQEALSIWIMPVIAVTFLWTVCAKVWIIPILLPNVWKGYCVLLPENIPAISPSILDGCYGLFLRRHVNSKLVLFLWRCWIVVADWTENRLSIFLWKQKAWSSLFTEILQARLAFIAPDRQRLCKEFRCLYRG